MRLMAMPSLSHPRDRRVGFVGIDAYEKAGGTILHDLFEGDGGGWFQDVALLDRLAGEKLAAEADRIRTEGWKWVTAAFQHPYGHSQGMTRVWGVPAELTDDEKAAMDALVTEQQKIEDHHAEADELPEAIDARLGEIEAQLEAFENRPAVFNAGQIAHAGVFVSINHDGSLLIERGFLRSEDADALHNDGDVGDTHDERDPGDYTEDDGPIDPAGAAGPANSSTDDDEEDGGKPLPERLLGELTAFRTLALRDAVAEHPNIALTLLLHQLVTDRFYYRSLGGCLQMVLQEQHFPFQGKDLADSPPARMIAERHENWKADIPEDHATLWDWLSDLDAHSRMSLLAHCLSFGVTALHERADRFSNPSGATIQRLADADRLASAVALDMVEAGWSPTVDSYLSRVTKAQILEAVREARGQRAGDRIEHLKKAEMAEHAQELLANSGWLPAALRTPGLATLPAQLVDPRADHAEIPVGPVPESDAAGEPAEVHPVAAE